MLDSQAAVRNENIPAPGNPQSLWRNKQFSLLLIGFTLSMFGNSFHNIALNLWVLQQTGSAKMMAVILTTNLILSSLLGSVAGTFADRMDRRKLMLASNLIRTVLVLFIALLVAMPSTPFYLILVLTAIVTIAGLVQSPALNASLTMIVGRDRIQQATGIMSMSDNISRTVGFAVGGMFVAGFGGTWAILFDAVTFLIAFFLVLFAGRFPSPIRTVQSTRNFKEDLLTGLRYIWQDPFAQSVTILSPMVTLFFMCALMLTQVMAVQVWHATPFQFGLFEACIPLGYMLGAGIIVRLDSRLKNRGKLIMLGLLMLGPAYILLSFISSAAWAIPIILVIGFMFSFCTLLINIILRLEVSDELQGRVFGTLGSLMSVTPSVGIVISSFFADLYGSEAVLLTIGMLLALFGGFAAIRLKVISQYD